MSNSDSGNSCRTICWVVAGLIGLLALFLVWGPLGFFAALLIGVALAVILGLVLAQLFCSRAGEVQAAPGPAPQATNADTPAPATAVAGAGKEVSSKSDDAADRATSKGSEEVAATPDYDGDGVQEGTAEGIRPEALSGPRDGQADDLKQIKGVGPKLEKLLNSMGFYHFDQVAGWTADEVAWVDANLQGFKGRVSRDNWVEQAKVLASGGQTEFSQRVEDGDVY